MGIFKIWIWGRSASSRRSSRRPVATGKTGGTPLHSVRRRYLLFGESYGVVLHREATRNSLKIKDNNFHLSLHPATRENFEEFLQNWYRRQARKSFQAAVDRWLPLFRAAGYAIAPPRLKIFVMRRAWGRCYYTKGLITLNLHLVKTPQACIDYIVLHELCHFVVSNHSQAFYRLVESFLPGWREADAQLKAFAREQRIIR
ncbi:SprT-like domain-containing protein [uncultured Rikenella sp.]|uniref:M48 family metallopeptidase n=1 Tax=uncultured Rikenella sp. TaxID=368003 RepID=UPI002632DDC4|nr:SprT-like domain-containing protein [uncultured Rikenella sp.]